MSINNVSNLLTNVYPYTNNVEKNKVKEGGFTENLQNPEVNITSKVKCTNQLSTAEIYQMMRKVGENKVKAEKEEDAKTECSQEETEPDVENETKTNIVVKPDGSRVLIITMSIGGMETTLNLEISKPTTMQNDNSKQDTESNISDTETNMVLDEMANATGEL